MPRRPALTAVATLSTLLLLTSCNGSPEAGRPNTTSTSASSTPTSTPAPTPTAPSTPTWTAEEQSAITAAKTRFISAWAAIDIALNDPVTATDKRLLQAGAGGAWLIKILGDVQMNQEHGLYQNGKTSVKILSVASVKLKAEQPEVRLIACLDTSRTALYFRKTRKPVPAIPANGRRHKVQAQVVYASLVGETTKNWFFVNETDQGTC
jgi:hypothetical protein